MQARDYPPRRLHISGALSTFQRSIWIEPYADRRPEIPYEGSSFPALFWKADRATAGRRRRWCAATIDSTKELVIWTGHLPLLTARHIRAVC